MAESRNRGRSSQKERKDARLASMVADALTTCPAPRRSRSRPTSPTSVEKTGTPIASASSIAMGSPSYAEVMTRASAIANTSATSSRKGRRWTLASPLCRIASSTAPASSSPSPNIKKCAGRSRGRTWRVQESPSVASAPSFEPERRTTALLPAPEFLAQRSAFPRGVPRRIESILVVAVIDEIDTIGVDADVLGEHSPDARIDGDMTIERKNAGLAAPSDPSGFCVIRDLAHDRCVPECSSDVGGMVTEPRRSIAQPDGQGRTPASNHPTSKDASLVVQVRPDRTTQFRAL